MERENVERNFGFLMHDIARLMRTSYDRRVKRFGLTRSQWWVITNLYRNDGLTQSELAETLDIERGVARTAPRPAGGERLGAPRTLQPGPARENGSGWPTRSVR